MAVDAFEDPSCSRRIDDSVPRRLDWDRVQWIFLVQGNRRAFLEVFVSLRFAIRYSDVKRCFHSQTTSGKVVVGGLRPT